MDDKTKELCRYRIENAIDSLNVAKLSIEHKCYKDAVNRAYYSAFYAIKAVLALKTVDFKRHKDVVAYFNKEYVSTELFPKEIGKELGNLKRVREKGDYNDFFIVSKEDAQEQVDAAEDIINTVIEQLKDKIDN